MKSAPFRGQVVIVTGASAGIGKSLALQLAAQGAKLVLAARRVDRLEQISAECRQLGGEALVIPTDVSVEAQCRDLIEKSVATFGRLDMLVNNAGMAATALLDEFPDLQLFKQTLDINFYGAVYCTYYALPHLKRSTGRIVAVSSLGGKSAIPYNTPYCASKYALHGFCDSLRMELAPHGVSCTVICPSWVITEFHEAQLTKEGIAVGKRGRAIYAKNAMTADRCAQLTLEAAAKRKRELLMGPGFWAVLFKTLAPDLLDWLTIKLFLEPAIKRARAGKIEA